MPAVIFTSSLGLAFLPSAGCDKTNPDDFRAPGSDASTSERGDAGDAGEVAPESVTFPQGFLWGSATSAFQTEKGLVHTDWSKWVATPGKIKRGETPDVGGPDSLNHIDDDIRALKDSGQNAYRFSLEWGRIYPTRAAFDADTPDAAAIAAYDGLLTKLRAANIRPLVTLLHYSLPDYLSTPANTQGWEHPDATSLFVKFCSRMAARFKDKVDDWVTINEPLLVSFSGYVAGTYPPGVVGDTLRAFNVTRIQARAHALAYDAIHTADNVSASGADAGEAPARVSVAVHSSTFHPFNRLDPADVSAAAHVDYVWNRWFLNAIVKGDWDDDFDEKYDGPNDQQGMASLKGRADYIGVNYYSDTLVSATQEPKIPVINAALITEHLNSGRPTTDFAWDIYPEGLRTVLLEANDYGLPILITENGLADASDKNRPRFIAEHVYQAGWAMQQGVKLLGYFHWSLVDNFEWDSGYCPKFGFYSVDPKTAARTARPSAAAYKALIEAGTLRRDQMSLLPVYSAPTFCE